VFSKYSSSVVEDKVMDLDEPHEENTKIQVPKSSKTTKPKVNKGRTSKETRGKQVKKAKAKSAISDEDVISLSSSDRSEDDFDLANKIAKLKLKTGVGKGSRAKREENLDEKKQESTKKALAPTGQKRGLKKPPPTTPVRQKITLHPDIGVTPTKSPPKKKSKKLVKVSSIAEDSDDLVEVQNIIPDPPKRNQRSAREKAVLNFSVGEDTVSESGESDFGSVQSISDDESLSS
jgi:hypothetical protein